MKVSAEVVFQDFFAQPAGNVTNSVPWIDVEGNGWQSGAAVSQLALDGSGHLYNAAVNAGTTAGVQLVPIGPHGSMTASAVMQLPTGFNEWIGMGFGNSNQFLTAPASGSGPWIQVFGSGTVTLYGGAALNNPVTAPNAFTNNGSPVQIFLTYDAFHATASVGTVSGGVTNLIFDQWPVTNSAGAVAPRYLIFQMSTNLTTPTARWATAATVDWMPRPPPMLTLPVPVQQTNFVGSPTAPTTCRSSRTRSIPSATSPDGDGNPFHGGRDLHHHQWLADRSTFRSILSQARPMCWSMATAAKS